jgi:hypothetical protein
MCEETLAQATTISLRKSMAELQHWKSLCRPGHHPKVLIPADYMRYYYQNRREYIPIVDTSGAICPTHGVFGQYSEGEEKLTLP